MRTLVSVLLISILWFAHVAFAQIVPAPSTGPSNPVIQFKANGFGYQYDQSGRSTTFYEFGNGMTGYTSRDQYGQIDAQGTIYDAIPRDTLTAPAYVPPPASSSRSSSEFRSIQDYGLRP